MSRQIYNMKVLSVRDLTSTVRELVVENVKSDANNLDFQFQAGQFVMLHVPSGEPKPILRAYSLASDARVKNRFKLLFKYLENGKASEFVWKLKGGETLQFTGPFGKVFFNPNPPENILMLCTSTGLAQHLSYLETFLEQYQDRHFYLYFGVQTEKDQFCIHELIELTKQHKNFKFHVVLSQPPETWLGKKGYVQHHLMDHPEWISKSEIYLCGNKAMIHDVKELLAAQNFDVTKLHVEAF